MLNIPGPDVIAEAARVKLADGKRTEGAMLLEDLSHSKDVGTLRAALQVALEALRAIGDSHAQRGRPARVATGISRVEIRRRLAWNSYLLSVISRDLLDGHKLGPNSLETMLFLIRGSFDDEPDDLLLEDLRAWRVSQLEDEETAKVARDFLAEHARAELSRRKYDSIPRRTFKREIKRRIAAEFGLSAEFTRRFTWNCGS